MKRLLVLAFLPVLLSGLETVNLIKDAGFEKSNEDWIMWSYATGVYDSTEIDRHEPDSAYIKEFCGSIDTRTQPADVLPEMYYTTGRLYQILVYQKNLDDLDSLELNHMSIFREGQKAFTYNYGIRLEFSDPISEDIIEVWFPWSAPDYDDPVDELNLKFFPDTILSEGEWYKLERDLKDDLINTKGLSAELQLDSFLLYSSGTQFSIWRGQKAFFDGIRLMGYADYDVGVKEILSGDSLEVGTPYAPIARIKNFGRENADSFLVIAEIADGASIIYSDTLPWTLEGDTEDTVTFADFDPPTTGPYTLTIRTFMEPDECDEDDEVSKEIGHSAIAESTQPSDLTLEVRSITSPLRVAYSLPYGKRGTLTLYDASGRRLERITVTHPGSVELDSAQASGVYLIRLEVGDYSISRKAVLLK